MSRFSKIIAVCAGALLAVLPLHSAEAATTKKKSTTTKKSSTTTKKKSTPGSDDKKPSEDDADAAGTKKGKALDLPLPEKPSGAAEGTTEKKSSEAASSKTKSSEKSSGVSTKDKEPEKAAPAESKEKSPEKSGAEEAKAKPERAPSATVEPDAIVEFGAQPTRIQQLIRDSIELTRLNLTYTFGSADPDKGGMDCSGTMFYVLNAHGFKDVPRDSRGQYMWARKSGAFFPVVSSSAESEEFKELLPGDLMFWTGTYQTGRDIPISHVMMYLGREKEGNKRIMFGASDGRSYNGIQRWGVSVFDFKMPRADGNGGDKPGPRFVGYARIPGLRSGLVTAAEAIASGPKTDDTPKTEDVPKTEGGFKAKSAPKTTPKPTASTSSKKKGKSAKSN